MHCFVLISGVWEATWLGRLSRLKAAKSPMKHLALFKGTESGGGAGNGLWKELSSKLHDYGKGELFMEHQLCIHCAGLRPTISAQLSAPGDRRGSCREPEGSSFQGKGRQLRSGTTLNMVAIITVPGNLGYRYGNACFLLDTLSSILYKPTHLNSSGSRPGRHHA